MSLAIPGFSRLILPFSFGTSILPPSAALVEDVPGVEKPLWRLAWHQIQGAMFDTPYSVARQRQDGICSLDIGKSVGQRGQRSLV